MPNPPRRPFARRISQLTPFKVMEVLDAVTARQAAGEDIIRMEVEEPVFDLPPRMPDAARDALERGDARGYTPSMGLPALRAAVAGFYRLRHGIDLDPARVMITTGSSAALGMLCDLLLDPGDS